MGTIIRFLLLFVAISLLTGKTCYGFGRVSNPSYSARATKGKAGESGGSGLGISSTDGRNCMELGCLALDCSDDECSNMTLLQVLESNSQLSTFFTLLGAMPELKKSMENEDLVLDTIYTVFAPTNAGECYILDDM